jgi:hypothetical protein
MKPLAATPFDFILGTALTILLRTLREVKELLKKLK